MVVLKIADQLFDVDLKQVVDLPIKSIFDVSNSSYMIQIEKIDWSTLIVTGALNGYSENCLSQFKDERVELISDKQYQTDVIWTQVQRERDRQDKKFGIRDMAPNIWLPILGEEVGEVNKAICEIQFDNASTQNYRDELIQVAAVAVAMIESLDRQELRNQQSDE